MRITSDLPGLSVAMAFGRERVVVIRGEVDIATVPLLRSALVAVDALYRCERSSEPTVVDVSAVSFIDASGLGVLVGAARHARDRGARVVLRHPRPMMLRVLEITDLTGAFEIDFDSAGDAVAQSRRATARVVA